jgi:hypothetical protein
LEGFAHCYLVRMISWLEVTDVDSLDDYNADACVQIIVGRRDSLSNHLEIEKCLHLPQANEEIITSNTECYPKPPIRWIMISVPRSL